MTEVYAKQTNAALARAKVMIESAEVQLSEGGWSQTIKLTALCQAALLQLMLAMHAYRRELAENSNFPTAGINELSDLVTLFEGQGAVTGEVSELQILSENLSSWLIKLERGYAQCWEPEAQASTSSREAQTSEIQLFEVKGPSASQLSSAELNWIYSELSSLIARHRLSMQEW